MVLRSSDEETQRIRQIIQPLIKWADVLGSYAITSGASNFSADTAYRAEVLHPLIWPYMSKNLCLIIFLTVAVDYDISFFTFSDMNTIMVDIQNRF